MRVTLPDMIRCAEREVEMRKRVYGKWVETGKMKRETAVLELTHMRAITMVLKGMSSLAGLLEGVDMPGDDKTGDHKKDAAQ